MQVTMQELLRGYTSGLASALDALSLDLIEQVTDVLWEARLRRSHIFIAGNGGSAATASHMVVDLNKLTVVEGVPSLRAISLSDNIPSITAWANDMAYESIFSKQLEGMAAPGDVLIAISTSGMSRNVLRAVEVAAARGLTSIGLTGPTGGLIKDLVDICVMVDSEQTGQIEDVHLAIGHMLSQAILARAQS